MRSETTPQFTTRLRLDFALASFPFAVKSLDEKRITRRARFDHFSGKKTVNCVFLLKWRACKLNFTVNCFCDNLTFFSLINFHDPEVYFFLWIYLKKKKKTLSVEKMYICIRCNVYVKNVISINVYQIFRLGNWLFLEPSSYSLIFFISARE